MKRIQSRSRALITLLALPLLIFNSQWSTVLAQGTAFTYQGRLNDNSAAANGNYDLRFTIYDALTNGSAVTGSLTNAPTSVGNGLFTVTLDFGGGVFDGSMRWLEIAVRTNGAGVFTNLSPRQKITTTPYAIQAANAANATTANNFSGSLSGDVMGNQGATVVGSVGGQTAANVASATSVANAATSANTANTIVKRDASGNFIAGTIIANLTGNATTATTAANLSGNVSDTQLSANIARLNGTNVFTGINNFAAAIILTNPANTLVGTHSGDGTGLSNLPAANLSGVIGDSLLSPNIARLNASQTFSGAILFSNGSNSFIGNFAGNAGGLTNLNASNLAGTISVAQLPPVVLTNGASGVNLTGSFTGNGIGITNLDVVTAFQPTITSFPVVWGGNFSGQTNIPALSNVVAVSGGWNHVLALKRDGTVVGWGGNNHGQTDIPGGLSNVVAVAAGWDNSFALKNDGTVVAWGDNGWGQTTIPNGLSNVVAIACAAHHNLALRNDGTVVGWGVNLTGQTNVPGGLSNVVRIAAGYGHSLALKSDGKVVAWGSITYGETTIPGGLSNVVGIAAGDAHSLALKSDGTVVGWGNNVYGQTTNIPSGLNDVVSIAAGGAHSLALKSDGTVVAWGLNTSGQTNVPVGLNNIIAIAGSEFNSLAIRTASASVRLALLTQATVFQDSVSAVSFAGNGTGLTNLNASQVTSGTISDSRLSANVALLNATQTFIGTNSFTNAANQFTGSFAGNGSGLTNINFSTVQTAANYVHSYSTTTQTVAVINTFQDITNQVDAHISNWTHTAGTTSFTNAQTGLYLVQYTAIATVTSATATTITLRAVFINGTEISDSQSTAVANTANQTVPISKSFIASFSAGDVLKFQLAGSGTIARIVPNFGLGTTRPSFSCTIIRIQ